MHRVLALSILAAHAAATPANDADWAAIGSARNYDENPHVQMVTEDLHITLTDRDMIVRVEYTFKNHGPATTVTMAFPDETTINHGWTFEGDDAEGPAHVIRKIYSKVDGKPVPLALRAVANARDDELGFKAVWIKEVAFASGQSRKVGVSYVGGHAFAGSGFVEDSYLFETGATWRGKIERLNVTVDWSQLKELSRPELGIYREKGEGPQLATSGKTARIELRNVEPDFNLSIAMVPGFWHFSLNGVTRSVMHGMPENPGVPAVLGPGRDCLIAEDRLGNFFGTRNGVNHPWEYGPVKRITGGDAELLSDGKTIRLATGKKLQLRRSAVDRDGTRYVYLRDFVEALGGAYRYLPEKDRVDITIR